MTEKKYQEVEIVGKFNNNNEYSKSDESKKSDRAFDDIFDIDDNGFKSKVDDNKKKLKKKILFKLLPYLFFLILLIIGLFWIIFIIFDNPFDYIFAGLLAFSILKTLYRFSRFIK